MALSFSDRFTTTLASGYTSGGVTLLLTSISGLGISGACTFWLIVQADGANTEEVFKVTNVSSTTLTVVGAQANTSASNHGAGAVVFATIMPKDAYTQYAADIVASVGVSGLVLLQQQTASNSTSLDFASWYSSTYDDYEVHVLNWIPVTNLATLRIRVSTDGGSTYDSGANYSYVYSITRAGGPGTGGNTAQTAIEGSPAQYNVGGTWSTSGTIHIINPASSSLYKFMEMTWTGNDGTSRLLMSSQGIYEVTTAIDAFQLYCSTGNISSGIVRVYGVSK